MKAEPPPSKYELARARDEMVRTLQESMAAYRAAALAGSEFLRAVERLQELQQAARAAAEVPVDVPE